MTEFVLQRSLKCISEYTVLDAFKDGAKATNEIFSYANFLNQPLTLGMFVPCDEDGNVLEEPKGTDLNSSFFEMQVDYNLEKKYKQAKDKVLFDINDRYCPKLIIELNTNIESITSLDIKLTPNAIKQLKL